MSYPVDALYKAIYLFDVLCKGFYLLDVYKSFHLFDIVVKKNLIHLM